MPGTELRVCVSGDPDADPDEIECLSQQLLSELKELDIVESLHPATIAESPPGSKGSAEIVTAGQWLLTLSASGGALVMVLGTLRDWLERRRGTTKLSVTINGDTIDLENASKAERDALVEAFVRRHSIGQNE